MKLFIIRVAFYLGKISASLFPERLISKFTNFFHFFHSGRIVAILKSSNPDALFKYPTYLKGGKYISIGKNFNSSYRLRIEAWDKYNDMNFEPSITIGDNVSFSDNCHLGAINSIIIGNNVLVGSNIYITDHFHGESTNSELYLAPVLRNLVSKGPVIIGDDVWIGDGVIIMPNVKLGKSCIVGANSVVTKSFPDNCILGGSPAKIIKNLNK